MTRPDHAADPGELRRRRTSRLARLQSYLGDHVAALHPPAEIAAIRREVRELRTKLEGTA